MLSSPSGMNGRHLKVSDDRYVYSAQNEERRTMRFVRMRQICDGSGCSAANEKIIGMKSDRI